MIRGRAGAAFDPAVAAVLVADAAAILALDGERPAWDEVLAREPGDRLILRGPSVDQALAAMGDFADLASSYLVGHAAGVTDLAGRAARQPGVPAADEVTVRQAARVHDLGRVAVPARIWQKPGPLTPTTGNGSGCTLTTPSGCCAVPRSSPPSHRSPPRITSGWTAPDTTGEPPPPFPRSPDCSPPRTPTTR